MRRHCAKRLAGNPKKNRLRRGQIAANSAIKAHSEDYRSAAATIPDAIHWYPDLKRSAEVLSQARHQPNTISLEFIVSDHRRD
jgi:hypothetical protein